MSMSEFVHMGGYAWFVWPSYFISIFVLWMNWYLPRRQHDKNLRQLKRIRRSKQ